MKNFLGIIGGLGSLASSHLYQMIIKKTKVTSDQEHINMIIYNHATIPDRTAYILDNKKESPLPYLKEDIKELTNLGANLIIIPCNTSHFFYNELVKTTNVPILNMIEDTVKHIQERKIKKVLILATSGTIKSRLYQNMCEKYKIDYIEPNETLQNNIMDIIYNNIKSGKMITKELLEEVLSEYKDIDAYILGCTELSILKSELKLNDKFIDPLEIETEKIIKYFNKEIKE